MRAPGAQHDDSTDVAGASDTSPDVAASSDDAAVAPDTTSDSRQDTRDAATVISPDTDVDEAGELPAGDLVGARLDGRFDVLSQLGEGGMARIYVARDRARSVDVAIKVLHTHLASEPTIVKRFAREARLAAKLVHPNIVPLVHVGEHARSAFIAMELARGVTLAARLRERGRLPESEAVTLAAQIAAALEHAHAHGVIHRDVKPSNMILCPDGGGETLKLLDFGIAKVRARDPDAVASSQAISAPLTTEGTVLGTPRYMAPEQAGGAPIDHRTDLYSLGVILYQMATGEPPFTGDTSVDLIGAHLLQPPRPPSRLVPGMHVGLEALILDLLRKAPEARPQSALEVRRRLEKLLPELSTSTSTPHVAVPETMPEGPGKGPMSTVRMHQHPPPGVAPIPPTVPDTAATEPRTTIPVAGPVDRSARALRKAIVGRARRYVSHEPREGESGAPVAAVTPTKRLVVVVTASVIALLALALVARLVGAW